MKQPIRIAAITAVAVLGAWAILLNLWLKSDRTPVPTEKVRAGTMTVETLTRSIQDEIPVDRLSIREVEGIVIIRGSAREQGSIDRVSRLAKEGGFSRVANLIQVQTASNDELIERNIERRLAQTPGLDGCRFRIDSINGVVTVSGTVQRELQKDLTQSLVRHVEGVKEVHTDLRRL